MNRQLPEGWQEVRLGDVSSIHDGTHQTPKYVEEGIPFYSVENVTNNNFTNTKFIRRQVFEEECKHIKLEKGDILMTRIGDIGTSKYVTWKVEASFYVSLALIKTKYPLDSHFLHFYISGNDFKKELWKRTIHVAFPRKINLGEIGHCVVQFPPLPEQKAIANTLQTWDEAIDKTEALIVAKEKRFKWLLKRLISDQHNNPKWRKVRLGEVGVVSSAGVDKKIIEEENPVRLVNYLDVLRKDFIFSDDLNHWVTAPKRKMIQCNVRKGDIFFTPSSEIQGDIAHSAVAMEDIDKAVYSYHIIRFRLNENWDTVFRAYVFKSSHFYKQAYRMCEGSGQRYVISQNYFRNMTICVPNLKEQKNIAQTLRTAQHEIGLLKQLANCYHTQKRGLMQKLLTGKWRPTPSFPRSSSSFPRTRESRHPYPEPRPKDYRE